jgi:hypothetical protein
MRIYINNFDDPAKIWQIDNGPGTRVRHYAKINIAKGVDFSIDQNLAAGIDEAKAWVYIDKAHVYFQTVSSGSGVEAYIYPKY